LAQEATEMIRLVVIGVGNRGTYLLRVALKAGVEVPALCDINEVHLNCAIAIVERARDGRKPAGYSKGPKDYQRMLQRDDLDAVLVATPQPVHAEMSIDGLRTGKHVLSEVSAATTMDECWGLVRATEETGKIYMLAENCCYWRHLMIYTITCRASRHAPDRQKAAQAKRSGSKTAPRIGSRSTTTPRSSRIPNGSNGASRPSTPATAAAIFS